MLKKKRQERERRQTDRRVGRHAGRREGGKTGRGEGRKKNKDQRKNLLRPSVKRKGNILSRDLEVVWRWIVPQDWNMIEFEAAQLCS